MTLWFYSPLDDPGAWIEALGAAMPDLDVVVGDAVPDRARIDCALVYKPPPGRLADLPNLRAVFSLAAGVDRLLADPTLPDVPVCRMVEPSLTRTMADFALTVTLRVHRGVDRFERHQRRAHWAYELARLTDETTVAVLGLGAIGGTIAHRLRANGFRVLGWSRSGRPVAGVEDVAAGDEGLERVLAAADIVIAVLPATPATKGLFDARFFARMRGGAHFVNLGRGDQLVEAALLRALDAGRVGGATLDVFEEEPLPPDHPFWGHPSVLVTPHVAGSTVPRTGAAVVAENVRRLRSGRPLLHVVDRGAGY